MGKSPPYVDRLLLFGCLCILTVCGCDFIGGSTDNNGCGMIGNGVDVHGYPNLTVSFWDIEFPDSPVNFGWFEAEWESVLPLECAESVELSSNNFTAHTEAGSSNTGTVVVLAIYYLDGSRTLLRSLPSGLHLSFDLPEGPFMVYAFLIDGIGSRPEQPFSVTLETGISKHEVIIDPHTNTLPNAVALDVGYEDLSKIPPNGPILIEFESRDENPPYVPFAAIHRADEIHSWYAFDLILTRYGRMNFVFGDPPDESFRVLVFNLPRLYPPAIK